MTKIRGYYLIEVDATGRQDMTDGAPVSAYYGYDSDTQCVTVDGLIVRGNARDAAKKTRILQREWKQQGAQHTYCVSPLVDTQYFGAAHSKARQFCAKLMA